MGKQGTKGPLVAHETRLILAAGTRQDSVSSPGPRDLVHCKRRYKWAPGANTIILLYRQDTTLWCQTQKWAPRIDAAREPGSSQRWAVAPDVEGWTPVVDDPLADHLSLFE